MKIPRKTIINISIPLLILVIGSFVLLELKNETKLDSEIIMNKEPERFEVEKTKFEEQKIFEQEKQKFEEEKETFNWEKQMFEEVKKFERDKN